ncbi:sialate O-acetylesterase-like [Clytia hemisphaerica]
MQDKLYKSNILLPIGLTGESVWKIKLDPLEPPINKSNQPYEIIARSKWKGEEIEIKLEDVLFGDVWLCSGQSNMAFTVGMSSTSEEEFAAADERPDIRLFTVKRNYSEIAVNDIQYVNIWQNWTKASRESVGGPNFKYFSAVCWMFGRRLYDQYKIPIGLIATSWGGTRIEAWSSPTALAKCKLKHHEEPKSPQNSYSVLWNAMIYPFLNMTIKGAIWYQGEANSLYNSEIYACTFPEMINDWRKKWFEGTNGSTDQMLPFGFVQLATIDPKIPEQRFPRIRYEQTANYGYVPNPKQQNVFMAVAMDLPDDNSPYGAVHPRDKNTVAYRLSLGARAMVYGEINITFQGAIMESCKIMSMEGKSYVRVSFRGADEEGLLIKSHDGFEVQIKGTGQWTATKMIFSPSSDPVGIYLTIPSNQNVTAVRYAWSNRPCDYQRCAIYSLDYGLPSPPGLCFIP